VDVEPIVRHAEMIVELENQRVTLAGAQRRCVGAALFLILAGTATALSGVLLAPRPESLLYLAGGMLDGVLLWVVVSNYRENRRLLREIRQLQFYNR
jgi:Flp pilus assembly protein TadB